MYQIMREAQMRAEKAGNNKSDDPDQKEHDAQKCTDGFCHDLSFLSF